MLQLIRGFKDILPGEVELWQHIEDQARALFADFGYREIRVPLLEKTALFARGIGEDTDIVEKEMYTFADRGGEMITLRPEATASIVRAYIQHRFPAVDPVQKFFTIGPMFRRERPQKGRYRQFYQINAEALGIAEPLIDVQLIHLLVRLLQRLQVDDATPHINSLGCPVCRPAFRQALLAFIAERREALCADCRRRSSRNPMRVLDCKVPGCREAMAEAPAMIDHLCPACAVHFAVVREKLERLGIAYHLDKRLVRGLDYYTRTTFEIHTAALGAQSAVAGGGRYDGLIELLGGPPTPGVGFAVGFDRLAEIVALQQVDFSRPPRLFIAALGPAAQAAAFDWQTALAEAGLHVEMDYADRSLKAQMKRADRLGAPLVLIVGDNELKAGEAMLRDMATRDQTPVALDRLVETLRQNLENS
jgi:histidyl-tRNA synthetase